MYVLVITVKRIQRNVTFLGYGATASTYPNSRPDRRLYPLCPSTSWSFWRQVLALGRGTMYNVYLSAFHLSSSCVVSGGDWGIRTDVNNFVSWVVSCSTFERLSFYRRSIALYTGMWPWSDDVIQARNNHTYRVSTKACPCRGAVQLLFLLDLRKVHVVGLWCVIAFCCV